MIKSTNIVFTALIVFVALLVKPSATPSAATCFSNECNGQYPTETGCAADSYVVGGGPIYDPQVGQIIGGVSLRYSPACQTVWSEASPTVCLSALT